MEKHNRLLDLLGKFLLIIGIILTVGGIGLLIWCGIGQFNAQMLLDGQYIQWRIVDDVSLYGFWGIPSLVFGFIFVAVGLHIL